MSEEPDISAVPVYDDFFHKHESYEPPGTYCHHD